MRRSSNHKGTAVLEPPRELSPEEVAFRDNPVLFVEVARDWAAGGNAPTPAHEAWLRELPVRRIREPKAARAALWEVLSYPERGRAIAWLDRTGLLEEIFPIWYGEARLRELRLKAVEEVHLERWAKGLSKLALNRLNKYMDQRIDNQLNGWALASLATLLLESNGYTERYGERLNEELRELGATDNERMRVLTAVIENPFLQVAFARESEYAEQKFSPTTIVAVLATLFADERATSEQRAQAMRLADRMLTK